MYKNKAIKILFENNGKSEIISSEHEVLVKSIFDKIEGLEKENVIACKVNNEVSSLSYKIKINSKVEFVTINTSEGMEVYRRTLSFLLEKVIADIFPERCLVIGHSLGPGYYFDLIGAELSEDDVKLIEEKMQEEVLRDTPIIRDRISYEEALEYFKENNREDKYKLISAMNYSKFSIYRCENFFQVVDMPLAARTGILKIFKLIYYKPGFIIQFPKRESSGKVADFTEQKNIFKVYNEYKNWGKILKVNNVGLLNEIIYNNGIRDFVQVAETLHAKKITFLAEEIFKQKERVKLVAIAGPSSSGKTTFSKRLEIQLRALGLKPVTISVDNYFVDREKTPLDEDGKLDYETIDAINTELFNEHLKSLMDGKVVHPAHYNFFTGKSGLSDKSLKISGNEILLIEGIHCLNEKLTFLAPKENKFKIYISVLTQMNIDNNNRIPTTDNRIIRRIVRDNKYRGNSALKTLQTWPSVRRGEEKYIFPFQNDADGYFNSALDYELALLRPYAEPLLMQIKPSHKEYAEAVRLLKFLSYFLMITEKDIPATSLIREFIGGSFFSY